MTCADLGSCRQAQPAQSTTPESATARHLDTSSSLLVTNTLKSIATVLLRLWYIQTKITSTHINFQPAPPAPGHRSSTTSSSPLTKVSQLSNIQNIKLHPHRQTWTLPPTNPPPPNNPAPPSPSTATALNAPSPPLAGLGGRLLPQPQTPTPPNALLPPLQTAEHTIPGASPPGDIKTGDTTPPLSPAAAAISNPATYRPPHHHQGGLHQERR